MNSFEEFDVNIFCSMCLWVNVLKFYVPVLLNTEDCDIHFMIIDHLLKSTKKSMLIDANVLSTSKG